MSDYNSDYNSDPVLVVQNYNKGGSMSGFENSQTGIITGVSGYPTLVAPPRKVYSGKVEEIHRKFEIAGDETLRQAIEFINQSKINEAKINRLSSVGFKNVPEVKEGNKIIEEKRMNEELTRLIRHYQFNYPNHKFITKDQVEAICTKYKLVCGEISRYKGFVPDKNLKDIESFHLKYDDVQHEFIVNSISFVYQYSESTERVATEKYIKDNNSILKGITSLYDAAVFLRNKFKVSIDRIIGQHLTNVNNYQICAPKKDMDLKGVIRKGFFYFTKNITSFSTTPDPVVLQPVKNGFLILSMWADETFDPHTEPTLINEKLN